MKPSTTMLVVSLVCLSATAFFIAARLWMPAFFAGVGALIAADMAAREAVHERREARR